MNIENMKTILEKIKEYNKIIIFRHKRPDGDCVGSTKGFQRILQLTFPEKEILLINSDYADYTAFLGDEDKDIADEQYKEALGIVIDTATKERISNPKYTLCRELIKIDHHIPIQSYANYEWVEEERSSACEMIAKFYEVFRDELKIDKKAAEYMVTDSGRFRFRSVSGETMRLAGMLLDLGIDIDTIYANLYMKEFHTLKFQAYVNNKIGITENGVAYIFVDKKMQKKFSLTYEEASNSVSYMDSIKNSLIWIAFIEGEGEIRVRLRSRFVTVNPIAEKWGGGGHDCACGATLKNKKEIKMLLLEADERLKEYKASNEGWL